MKSRNSIFTRRGRSRLLRSMSAVTMGYRSNSSVLSCGNAFFLGVHRLSLAVSPSPRRVAFPRLWWCGRRAAVRAGRAPRARHCDARCENSWRKSCVTSGESMGAGGKRHKQVAIVAVLARTHVGELCGHCAKTEVSPNLRFPDHLRDWTTWLPAISNVRSLAVSHRSSVSAGSSLDNCIQQDIFIRSIR
jgi:hypothetical protein